MDEADEACVTQTKEIEVNGKKIVIDLVRPRSVFYFAINLIILFFDFDLF